MASRVNYSGLVIAGTGFFLTRFTVSLALYEDPTRFYFSGVAYGAVVELLGSSVSGIGVFYGQQDPVVGWITHEFHSVVFGFVFAGLLSLAPSRYHDSGLAYAAIGTGWGLTLWFLAAGFVAPVWLRLLGIPAGVPTFRVPLLASHLVWGLSLGLLTTLGYSTLIPWIRHRVS